jgi:hypothetical protein
VATVVVVARIVFRLFRPSFSAWLNLVVGESLFVVVRSLAELRFAD